MSFSKKDLEVIFHLNSDPLMSFQELADKLQVTWITAKNRYEKLRENKLLYNPIANVDYYVMGFSRVNIFATVSSYQSLLRLEEACYAHPYTNYRSRFIGRKFGLYMVFLIPETDQAKRNLITFFEILQKHEITEEFTQLNNETSSMSIPQNLNKFNFETMKWDFKWEVWFNDFDKRNSNTDELKNYLQLKDKMDLNLLTKENLIILNRITSNASIKQTELFRDNEMDISKTEAHRQYNFVMDNFISNIVNVYDRKLIGLSDLKMFHVKFKNNKKRDLFLLHLLENQPAFGVSIEKLEKNSLLFWSQMDQLSIQSLSFELFKRFEFCEIYDLVIHRSNSMSYKFYIHNFDFITKSWKDDTKWMLTDPLLYMNIDSNLS